MAESISQRMAGREPYLIVLSLALVALPALIWWESIGDVSVYIEYETPPGQVCYIISKLAGMYAVVLLWVQVILALVKGTSFADKLPFWDVRFHRNLGITTFAVLLLHAALFVAAASIRQAHFAYSLLLPNFGGGFYAFAVTLGVLALYGIVIAIIAGYARIRGIKTANWLHRVSILAFSMTLVHCLLIGSDTRSVLMMMVYALMAGTLLVALFHRIRSNRVLMGLRA